MLEIGTNKITLNDFYDVVYNNKLITISKEAQIRLNETREFIDFLQKNNKKVYGITTGFADLRNYIVDKEKSAQLSRNIILSHDAAIGDILPDEITLGAMFVRANTLAQGHSGFSMESLQTLVDMINKKIIPQVPKSGSLGASGDLAQLSRLGNAMMGSENVKVKYQDQIISAQQALRLEGIIPFNPKAKEGLALTNGTTFMASIFAISLRIQKLTFEQLLLGTSLFLNSIKCVDAAFSQCISDVRMQKGQIQISKIMNKSIHKSDFTDSHETQNDYCIRCMPQIYGPKLEQIQQSEEIAFNEINAITDNPLIFKNEEITPEVHENRIFTFKNNKWAVLSGGNFHGEIMSQTADILRICNAKIYVNVERQSSYMMNKDRNKVLPIYLIPSDPGLISGFMITHYTVNSLAQQMAHLANPMSTYNLSSGNESEDVVSYGHSSCLALYDQLKLAQQINQIFFSISTQAYSIQKIQTQKHLKKIPKSEIADQIFEFIDKEFKKIQIQFPLKEDQAFGLIYETMEKILSSEEFNKLNSLDIFEKEEPVPNKKIKF